MVETVWNSMDQCGATVEKHETMWWNSVEQYGGTVWNSVEQCGGTVEQCGRTLWNSLVEQWNGAHGGTV